MNRWNGWRDYPSGKKPPPPEHGIKMKKAGTTWWGQRWIEALESLLAGSAGRLQRGRTYARAGRTHDLGVEGGSVRALVTGSRATPYEVKIELAQLSAAVWTEAIAGMARKAQFSAELLAGEMPREIDEVFRAAGASLFPTQRKELTTQCSCPDWGDPCKHVAATHYVLGEALDRDPFLLFELRGRTKAQVLALLRTARAGDAATEAELALVDDAAPVVPKRSLAASELADYDEPPGLLPALSFSFDAPVTHGAVLKQLGVPATWSSADSPADALAPLVKAAAETARRIALSESESPAADGGEPAVRAPAPAPKRRAKTKAPARKRRSP